MIHRTETTSASFAVRDFAAPDPKWPGLQAGEFVVRVETSVIRQKREALVIWTWSIGRSDIAFEAGITTARLDHIERLEGLIIPDADAKDAPGYNEGVQSCIDAIKALAYPESADEDTLADT